MSKELMSFPIDLEIEIDGVPAEARSLLIANIRRLLESDQPHLSVTYYQSSGTFDAHGLSSGFSASFKITANTKVGEALLTTTR